MRFMLFFTKYVTSRQHLPVSAAQVTRFFEHEEGTSTCTPGAFWETFDWILGIPGLKTAAEPL